MLLPVSIPRVFPADRDRALLLGTTEVLAGRGDRAAERLLVEVEGSAEPVEALRELAGGTPRAECTAVVVLVLNAGMWEVSCELRTPSPVRFVAGVRRVVAAVVVAAVVGRSFVDVEKPALPLEGAAMAP